MKKLTFSVSLLTILCFGLLLWSYGSDLDKAIKTVFEKEWVDMSQADKEKLEGLFVKEGMEDCREYWEYCCDVANEDPATTERHNPWADVPALPLRVRVYIDNSGSMKGYFDASNSAPLVDVLSALSVEYKDDIMGCYAEKDTVKQYPWNQVVDNLTNKKFEVSRDAIELGDLIRDILKQSKDSVKTARYINFILTDGIPSGTNAQIIDNREYNIQQKSKIQANIQNAFTGIDGVAASVYKFVSGFDGDYIGYDNITKWPYHRNRPFYLIVIGDPESVKKLSEKEHEGLDFFKPVQRVHFTPVNANKVTLSSSEFDNGTHVRAEFFDGEYNGVKGKDISLSLSLAEMPYFVRDSTYLRKHMSLTLDGQDLKYEFNKESGELYMNVKVHNEAQYKIALKILNSTPSWVKESDTENDISLYRTDRYDFENKTMNLMVLVEGIKKGVMHTNGDIKLIEKEYVIDTRESEN